MFPEISNIYSNSTYSGGWYDIWRKDKRICSEDLFEKYFLLGVPEGDISDDQMRIAIKNSHDLNEFDRILRNFSNQGLIQRFLYRLPDFIEKCSTKNIEVMIEAILSIGDELLTDIDRLYSSEIERTINWVCYDLLERIRDPEVRLKLLRDIVTECKFNITINLVSYLDRKEHTDDIIPEANLESIKNVALQRIQQEAKDENLSKSPILLSILSYWIKLSSIDEPKEYIQHMISTDQGIVDLLVAFLNVHVYGTGRPKLEITYTELGWMSKYLDTKDLLPRVELIKKDTFDSYSELEQHAVNQFLGNWNQKE